MNLRKLCAVRYMRSEYGYGGVPGKGFVVNTTGVRQTDLSTDTQLARCWS